MQLSPKQEDGEDFVLNSLSKQSVDENYQYYPIPMSSLNQPVNNKHLHADGIVEKAYEILPTSSFDLNAMSKRYNSSRSAYGKLTFA
jgi:hypothetical protein